MRGQLNELRTAFFTSGSYWQVANMKRREVIMHVTVCKTVNELTDRQTCREIMKLGKDD